MRGGQRWEQGESLGMSEMDGEEKKKPSNASVAGVPSSKSFRNKRVTEI